MLLRNYCFYSLKNAIECLLEGANTHAQLTVNRLKTDTYSALFISQNYWCQVTPYSL